MFATQAGKWEAGAFMSGQDKIAAVLATGKHLRATRLVLLATSLLVGAGSAYAQQRPQAILPNTDTGIDPFYTGSLLSPSPAVPKAGLYAFEPYVIETVNPGKYGARGGLSPVADTTSSTSTFTLNKYGITDHLSIEVSPQTQINQDQLGFNSGSQIADLPVELEYRFLDQDKKTGKPSLTFSAGVDVPTGRYQNLYSGLDGQGSGTYRARLGLVAQSLLYGQSQHPVRIRVWLDGAIPLGGVGINNISVFGTDTGFTGTGYSGISGTTGMSVEYSITQRLVFANDIQFQASRPSVAYGFTGGKTTYLRGSTSDNLQLAPAFEYSFNDYFGIIAGCAFSVEGHNTSQVIQPQIAFNFVLDTTKPMGGIPLLFTDLPGYQPAKY